MIDLMKLSIFSVWNTAMGKLKLIYTHLHELFAITIDLRKKSNRFNLIYLK